MQYRSVNARFKRDTNASISCENVVKIGSVTSEFKKGVCGIFATNGQKLDKNLHIPLNISLTSGPIFTKLSALLVIYMLIIII